MSRPKLYGKTISVQVDERTKGQLIDEAVSREEKVSDTVRRALKLYLNRERA